MKRLVITVMILITVLTLAACGDVPVQAPVASAPHAEETGEVEETEAPKADVGFSLAGENAFSEKLAADIQSECSALNIAAQVSIAATAEQQQQDISAMFSSDVSVIVVAPFDADSLETALAESEIYGVKVINALEPINGLVSMLISPDYKDIGKKAGQCAVELLGSTGGGCMLLNTRFDSFTMQLMTDGFNEAVSKDKDISVVSTQFCGSDKEQAYGKVKEELSAKNIGFIFAQNAALGRGAMRAAAESGKDVKVVVFGGDMDIIQSVSEGKAYACIFFGPQALAHETVLHADSFLKSGSYVPPEYVELSTVVVKQADAAGFYIENEPHAEIK